ncbi:diguanylate cyclase domain-containing protein [Primorskyibacter sp. S187A]|uniref:diguanylate cyclase domain-containing protein n=1 Tax=Primorskyibacter sp. S187A TaxID=3415130 RepID=UPI003C7B2560
MMHSSLDVLCPMHVELDATGHIVHAGPTLRKMIADGGVGRRFLEVFELRRPRSVSSMKDLRTMMGSKLHLRMRDAVSTGLKGVCVPAVQGDRLIVNLSFGISVVDAVRRYKLTSADFAATDLAIEMLYLVEAKSAAMDASRKLNQRLQGAMIAAEEQAFTDTLTGLKNRRALEHILGRFVEYGNDFTLMQLDLDFFKAVNDTMGHAAGDHVLLQVARILVEETREQDTVARVGGDEFVLVVNGALGAERIADICNRMIQRLEEPIPFGDEMCRISGSLGVATTAQYDDVDIPTMFEDVDIALYASKHAGRGCFTIYASDLRKEGVLQGLDGAA